MRCLCWVVSLIATVTFGNASLISLEFTDSHICDQYYLSKVLRTRESHPIIIHLHLVGYLLKFNDIRVSYFDKNNNILSCDIYSQQIHQETSSCARKELHDNAMKEDMLILSSPIHSSGEYLEVCLVPDVPDLNFTNVSQPTQSPTSKSRISAPTHPFMSTQAILIPLILFSLIAFGGLSYYFQLYRHLPFCAKPR